MISIENELRDWIISLKQNDKNVINGSFYVSQNSGNQRREFDNISLNAIDFVNQSKKVIVQLKNGQRYLLEYSRSYLLKNKENYDEHIKVTLQKKESF